MRDSNIDASPSSFRACGAERGGLIRPLLTDSFETWLEEIKDTEPWSHCVFRLYDQEGCELARSGDLQPETESRLQACAVQAAADGKAEEAREGWMLSARLVTGPPTSGLCAVLGFAMSPTLDPAACRMLVDTAALHFRSRCMMAGEHRLLRRIVAFQQEADRALKRKDQLYDAVRKLHDQIDVSSVLKEIIHITESLFAGAEVELHLSQDYATVDERVKTLTFKRGVENLCARSFLESRPLTELGEDGSAEVAVPFSGKQAVYGVLNMRLKPGEWNEAELPWVVMLAEEAGSAFEHAKLYEQSNMHVAELQLINDLARRLNQSLRLNEIFQFVTTELLDVFKAEFCSLLRFDSHERRFIVMSANIPDLINETFPADYGYCGIILQTKEPLIISDYRETEGVESRLMEMTDSRSLIASPIMVDGEVGGVILVTHRNASYFSYDDYKLLQVITSHVGLAISNATLHAEVRRMVITDNLTGLYARHYLNEQIQARQCQDACGSLILVDIDYFKQVNDTYGHQIGDRILIQVSEVIQSSIRESDIAARWGGEELAVYLPKVRVEQAGRIAERIRKRVAEETEPGVTVSCGVSEWTNQDEKISPESLFYRADMALYEAKHQGRNQVIVG